MTRFNTDRDFSRKWVDVSIEFFAFKTVIVVISIEEKYA